MRGVVSSRRGQRGPVGSRLARMEGCRSSWNSFAVRTLRPEAATGKTAAASRAPKAVPHVADEAARLVRQHRMVRQGLSQQAGIFSLVKDKVTSVARVRGLSRP